MNQQPLPLTIEDAKREYHTFLRLGSTAICYHCLKGEAHPVHQPVVKR